MSTMSAALCRYLLFGCFLISAAGAEPLPPPNVTLITLNTNYTLVWDWDRAAADGPNVTFTAEYLPKYKLKYKRTNLNWYKACDKTPHKSCDFTALDLHYLGIFVFRVRVNVNGNHSDWVQKEFCPDKDAALGPPTKVELKPAGSGLDIYISDPLTSTNLSMKEKIPELYYDIVYWKYTEDKRASRNHTLNSTMNVVTLSDLLAWTSYCVTIQSRHDYYKKRSVFTTPQCMQTEGPVPWWTIVRYFLGSLMICFLIVLLIVYVFFRCFKTVKSTFFPSGQLPKHFEEYFCDSPASDIPRLLSPDKEAEILCHKVTICPEPAFLEIHDPPPEALQELAQGLEPDSSGRHSRQGSSGSRDSGVYSTEGGSGLPQTSSGQSSTGAEDSWQAPIKQQEQVKMQDMAPELKSQRLMADEGVVDMCV
ncbi:interferon alpha/beta receptor 1b-like [Thunnus albacares]|uniref:interferon alpha/beta receptor 1b-like n=1 Tax=Thunnus albacares TaxID=8236 RepID=UPI001CF70A5F|nr:interferon alpha/beta receptor 1b-like [Thunnus albacares]